MPNKYGDWNDLESIGEGGQGQVFKVKKGDDDREYVLKRLKNIKRIHRFEREIKAIISLNSHPNILQYIDHDLSSNNPYLVTEFCEKGSLDKLDFSSYSTSKKLNLFKGICSGMAYVHINNIVHRDLKPANIFLRSDNTPVVGDFGICFLQQDDRLTRTDEAVGARNFMAPELEDGRLDNVHSSADVYSLGKILYWLLTRRIFSREKHRDENWLLGRKRSDNDSVELLYEESLINEILDQTIIDDPTKRYPNANELLKALGQLEWQLRYNSISTDRREFRICKFCGIGHYQIVIDTKDDLGVREADLEEFGVIKKKGAKFLVLWCNQCGNVQYFRRDILKNGDLWSKGLNNEGSNGSPTPSLKVQADIESTSITKKADKLTTSYDEELAKFVSVLNELGIEFELFNDGGREVYRLKLENQFKVVLSAVNNKFRVQAYKFDSIYGASLETANVDELPDVIKEIIENRTLQESPLPNNLNLDDY